MPIRGIVTWGNKNPLSDPRFVDLNQYVNDLRKNRRRPNVAGGGVFDNNNDDLPKRPPGHYREYDVTAPLPGFGRGTYRLVLGRNGEVFVTWDHYHDFLQIVGMPVG
jgi:guanyl-specific ribonuclease Sa